MNAKKNIPPPQEEVERRLRLILEQGDITDLSGLLGEPYSTLEKKLNPNKPARSDIYAAVWFLWHMRQLEDGEKKARQAVDLINELVFPTTDELQLISRIENDVARLKAKLTESSR